MRGTTPLVLLCMLLFAAASAAADEQPGSSSSSSKQPQKNTATTAKLKYDAVDVQKKDSYEPAEGHKDGYEKPYGCEDDDCPNPQVADSVTNAYVAHYTFVYADLAEQLAAGKVAQRSAERRTQQSLRDMPRRVRKPLKHTTSAAAADRKQSSAGNRLQGNTNKPAPAAPVAGAGGGAGARATPRNPLPPTNTNTNNKAAAGTPQNPKQQPQPQQQQNNRQSHHQQQQPPSKSSQDFWGPAVGAGGSEVKAPSWRQQPKQQQRPDMLASLQATSGQPDKQQPAAAAAAGEEGAASAKDSGATVARPAAVTYPKFLLPTSEHEHRRGFSGSEGPYWVNDEAIAVAEHPYSSDDVVVLHAINTQTEIFAATKDGELVPSTVPTLIQHEEQIVWPMLNDKLGASDPSAYYDRAEQRWVMAWTTYYYYEEQDPETDPEAPLIVCASAGRNPLSLWTCWALASSPIYPPELFYTPTSGSFYVADYPQLSYSADGIFISIGAFADRPDGTGSYQSGLHVFPKHVVFSTPSVDLPSGSPSIVVNRATYLPDRSWFRSLPLKDQVRIYDPESGDNTIPFNNWVLPSRPQRIEDSNDAVFFMKLYEVYGWNSIARLTKEPLDEMTSVQNAPKIYATMIQQGADLANTPGYEDGNYYIPQPGPVNPLDSGDTGLFGGRSYGATHYKGKLYFATSEYFGAGDSRTPSIYWGIAELSHKLCKASLLDWGMIASDQGLALGYPVIAARPEGGAFVAYAYGGNTDIKLGGEYWPAYAGVATTWVGCESVMEPHLTVVKTGNTLINTTRPVLNRWGDYSAIDWLDSEGSCAWFAVPVAIAGVGEYGCGSWLFPQDL